MPLLQTFLSKATPPLTVLHAYSRYALSQLYSKIYSNIYFSQLANGNMPICVLLQ